MSKNDLGGFFLNLGLRPDKHSFETGNKLIDGMTNGFNKLIATARNAAVVLATTAVASSKMEAAERLSADALGISSEKLEQWRISAKLVGADANGLISSMTQMEMTMRKMDLDGTLNQEWATKLGLEGLEYSKLADMDASERTKEIIRAAQTMQDQTHAAAIIRDLLGDAGEKFYHGLQEGKYTIDQVWNKAGKKNLVTDETTKAALTFTTELSGITTSIEQLTKLLGVDLGSKFTPYLVSINKWLDDNGETIAEKIGTITEYIATIAEVLAPIVSKVVIGTATTAEELLGAVAAISKGDKEGALKHLDAAGYDFGMAAAAVLTGKSITEAKQNYDDRTALIYKLAELYKNNGGKKLKYEELPKDVQDEVNRFGGKKKWSGYINDGIIRPNGQITQVAPDDWVFAARNVGDLAKAFMPQIRPGDINAPSQYNITQNFTITAGTDVAQLVRQQAYNGTRDGLQAILAQSSQRMQLMSGTL